MAQPSPLSSGLIRKGEAKPVSPEIAAGPAAQPAASEPALPPAMPAAQPEVPRNEPQGAQGAPSMTLEDLPIPPDTVPRALVSFRAPVQLTEELRLMAFETRRPKQELLTEFLSDGLKRWKAGRAKRAR